MLVDRGVAGIIFVSGLHADTTADMDRYAQLLGQGVPFVLRGRLRAEGAGAVHLRPTTGRRRGWRCTHLVALGHERIGLAVGPRRFVPVHPQDRGLPAGDGRSCWACRRGPRSWSSTRCSPWRAARRRPAR